MHGNAPARFGLVFRRDFQHRKSGGFLEKIRFDDEPGAFFEFDMAGGDVHGKSRCFGSLRFRSVADDGTKRVKFRNFSQQGPCGKTESDEGGELSPGGTEEFFLRHFAHPLVGYGVLGYVAEEALLQVAELSIGIRLLIECCEKSGTQFGMTRFDLEGKLANVGSPALNAY